MWDLHVASASHFRECTGFHMRPCLMTSGVSEYHGRSHFDSRAWTAYVASGEPVTSLYFDNGLTYYHYGRRNESSGFFHSTHSEYRSDDPIHQRPLDDMYVPQACRPKGFTPS